MPELPADLPLAAAITAGGQSRRFGQDKALYQIGGRSMLEIVGASLGHCSPRVLIAPAGRYTFSGWTQVADRRTGEGPLAGLESALSWLLGHLPTGGWLAFTAVDLPNLTPAYWTLLAQHREADSQAVVGLDLQDREQPLAALYHTRALPQVTALLDRDERRMKALLERLSLIRLGGSLIEASHPGVYLNLNRRPEEASQNVQPPQ